MGLEIIIFSSSSKAAPRRGFLAKPRHLLLAKNKAIAAMTMKKRTPSELDRMTTVLPGPTPTELLLAAFRAESPVLLLETEAVLLGVTELLRVLLRVLLTLAVGVKEAVPDGEVVELGVTVLQRLKKGDSVPERVGEGEFEGVAPRDNVAEVLALKDAGADTVVEGEGVPVEEALPVPVGEGVSDAELLTDTALAVTEGLAPELRVPVGELLREEDTVPELLPVPELVGVALEVALPVPVELRV